MLIPTTNDKNSYWTHIPERLVTSYTVNNTMRMFFVLSKSLSNQRTVEYCEY